jgi:GNAT superfamily N-acetyltransferase
VPPPLRAAAALGISYRPKTDEDLDFIERLYRSTREEELALSGWPEAFKRQFIAQQQFAQDRHLKLSHPDAEWLIVEREGEPIGRLYLDDLGDKLWLIDIALMPGSRGCGIGGAIIGDLIAQGRDEGKPVGLTVFKTNVARRLYERLGFTLVSDAEAYHEMIWTGDGGASGAA